MAELTEADFASFRKFVAEFSNESDRAAVILGAAKIDLVLHEILGRFLVASANSNDELLDGDAPLSTFSAKINATHRLGLITAEFARALHLIRRIRNSFAHELTGCDLNSGAHQDRVRELCAPFAKFSDNQHFKKGLFGKHTGASAEFRTALAIIVLRLEGLRDDLAPIESASACQLVPPAWLEKSASKEKEATKTPKNS